MKIRTFIVYVLSFLAFAACEEKTESAKISLSTNELSFAADGGVQSITITSNSAWSVSGTSGVWFEFDPSSGTGNATVSINVSANTGKEREGSIRFSSDDRTVSGTLTIRQEASDDNMELPDNILTENFSSGRGSFTIEDKTKPDAIKEIWKHDPKYGMVATGYLSEKNYETESWLVSPEIDLTQRQSAHLNFQHAGNFFLAEKIKEHATLKVSADGGETWEDVTIPNYFSGNDWNFVKSGNIDLGTKYHGKKIRIAFVYKSSTEKAGTWEVKNVQVNRNPSATTEEGDLGNTYNGVPVWMELPEIEDENTFHIHAVKDGGKRYRNYSMSYDEKHLVATWTAYPLCDWYFGSNSNKSDSWVANPYVENQANMAKAGDWFNPNGYERGHQIASADRLRSSALNQQTYYYTNAAPMLKQEQFNAGIWVDLENKVRDWSKASAGTDTLYVVTGAVVKDGGKTVKDNDGKPCTVPEAYFKALLRYDKDGKANSGYMAAGFYIEHKAYGKWDIFEHSMSLSDLEEKTGMKFFVNLEAAVGKDVVTKIKAEKPSDNSFWK